MAEIKKESLIVDAGSTKTQWIGNTGEYSVITPGINPVHLSDDELLTELVEASTQLPGKEYAAIAWYGAGCGSEQHCRRMENTLHKVFGNEVSVTVGSDLLCAARALSGKEPAIVCILGTGSNSGYYDGQNIVDNIPPLGYILGDEGSGAAIGKRLINAVLKRALPAELTDMLVQEGNIYKDYVQQIVYREPNPNKYLASLCKVVANHIDNTHIRELVKDELSLFVRNNILRYSQATNVPVHVTGGVTSICQPLLEEVLRSYGLQPGTIAHAPLDLPNAIQNLA